MMKKLLFLAVGAALSFSAGAQQTNSQSVVLLHTETKQTLGNKPMTYDQFKSLTPWRNDTRATGKATISGTRTYNYYDLIGALNTPVTNYPYLWQNGEGMGIYQGTSGLVVDTIRHHGYAAVLMPWYDYFNDKNALDYNGKVAIQNYTPYTVDSIGIYGIYGENSAKTNIVDTLIVSMVYGDGASGSDIFINRWWGGSIATDFNTDTLKIPDLRYDTTAYAIQGSTRVLKKIPLDANWRNDTLANGIHYFSIPFGVSVPAYNMVGVSVSFRSGDPNKPAPFTDTIFRGSTNSADPFKYNMFRPAMFGENDNQFPKYDAFNHNSGFLAERIYADTSTNIWKTYSRRYIPMYFYGAGSDNEHPIIDWVISCANCPAVGISDINEATTSMKVYPNPATNETKVSFDMGSSTNVKVSMSNLVGQVISSQDFNNVTSGVATFATSQLTNGVYIMSVEADGFRKVERVTIAH